jgi:hypothetical protein
MAVERTLNEPAGWCNAILSGADVSTSQTPSDDPELSDQIERDLWENLKVINGLSQDERLAMLRMHREHKEQRAQTGDDDDDDATGG